jgi:phage shock protein A
MKYIEDKLDKLYDSRSSLKESISDTEKDIKNSKTYLAECEIKQKIVDKEITFYQNIEERF